MYHEGGSKHLSTSFRGFLRVPAIAEGLAISHPSTFHIPVVPGVTHPQDPGGWMVPFLAKDSQHHCCPETGLLGRWPRAQPPWQPSTYSHHH